MGTLPPPQPSYIFRGHTSQIHSVQIVRQNSRLITADADGWVVCWNLESKRPVAVWRAHHASILATAEWGSDNLITHGRDNSLRIWQLRPIDESNCSTLLPADSPTAHRPKPWLLHALPVNTLNFCAFSMCYEQPALNRQQDNSPDSTPLTSSIDSILVAVPSRDDKKIEVYQFPGEKLVSFVPRVQTTDTGMVMTVKLTHHPSSNNILVIAGYEGGFTAVHLLDLGSRYSGKSIPEFAKLIYFSQPHTQPVLSLDATPDAKMYFTSSADAAIAAHRIPEIPTHIHHGDEPETIWKRKSNAPTQATTETSARITEDLTFEEEAEFMKLLTTENTSSSLPSISPPPSSLPSLSPLPPSTDAPLSFTKKPVPSVPSTSSTPTAGLSSLLSTAPSTFPLNPNLSTPSFSTALQPPYKVAQTKHAGQQSLSVRSDGRIFVTGGWDSRARVYSVKTLNEVACLKWHKEGVYAVGFGEVIDEGDSRNENKVEDGMTETKEGIGEGKKAKNDQDGDKGEVQVVKNSGLSKLQRQREEQIKRKHWVVAGSKDGKVSLWEVF